MKLIAPPPPPLFPPRRGDRRGGSSIGERSRPKIYFTGPRPAKLASFSSQRIISRLAKYLVADVKPQPPLEIAGIRGAVPLTFELHEYSRPKRSSREGPCVYTRSYIYILAFFSVFFSLPPPRIVSTRQFPRQFRPGTKVGISKVRWSKHLVTWGEEGG